MSKLLSGVTHAIVTIPTIQDATVSGIRAMVDLCFGPGDDTSLSGFRYLRTEDGNSIWQGPLIEVIREGRPVVLPVFKGSLLIETTRLASAAVARIKKDLGGPAWGTRYRILKDRVVIEDLLKE